nr:hypothetical protein [Candidatus Shapirobacteria bacterium]
SEYIDVKQFCEQAKIASILFTELDRIEPSPEALVLARTLASAGFVGKMKARYPDLYETSFPEWLKEAREQNHILDTELSVEAKAAYNEVVSKYGGKERISEDPNGNYIDFPQGITPPKSDKVYESMKGYLPQNINPEELKAVFDMMKDKKIFPHVTKMMKDPPRIVLYWNCEITASLIGAVEPYMVKIGQDSFRMITEGESISYRAISYDTTLGKGEQTVNFRQTEFNKDVFFRHYLEQCSKWWRNPSDPRWMSYLPIKYVNKS